MAKQGTQAWRRNMRKAGRIGGAARNLALSPERRSEIAKLGAAARHAKPLVPAA